MIYSDDLFHSSNTSTLKLVKSTKSQIVVSSKCNTDKTVLI